MKKAIAIVMALVICLSLCACKSEEAKAVDELILAIGKVDSESLDALVAARTAYDALVEKDQSDVEQYGTLVDAEAEFATQVFASVNALFESNDMQLADQYYQSFLADERIKFTDEQRKVMEENRERIKTMCFMGTYVVMPEYIIDIAIEDIDASLSRVKYCLSEPGVSVSYDFSSSGSTELALKQYLSYLDEYYYCYDSGIEDDWKHYNYTDEQGYEFAIGANSDWINSFYILFYRDFFDASRMDTSDPNMTIRWSAD